MEKKEYLPPKMEVVEEVFCGTLLQDSDTIDVEDEEDEEDCIKKLY